MGENYKKNPINLFQNISDMETKTKVSIPFSRLFMQLQWPDSAQFTNHKTAL